MHLAHGPGGGVVNFELLLFAVAMVVLGVTFFVQKSADLFITSVLIVGGIAMGVAAFVLH